MKGAKHFSPADVIAHATKNKVPIIDAQLREFLARGTMATAAIEQLGAGLKRKGSRKLKAHREPNETEREFGMILGSQKNRGEIEDFMFEGITLRWGDMEYTPDYFVIRHRCTLQYAGLDKNPVSATNPVRFMIEAVYIELKGGWKWEDSVIKFKAFRKAMPWAQFQFHQKIDGRWDQLA